MRKITVAIAAVFLCLAGFVILGLNIDTDWADQLDLTLSSTDGSACSALTDGAYYTENTEYFDPGTQITISADEAIDSLYIMWAYEPEEWTLKIGDNEYSCGQNGFLHEFVEIPEAEKGTRSVTIEITEERETIAEIYAFSEGELPDFVQKWEASYDKADILFLSTHADDEVLFFGTVIAQYVDQGDVRIQVAYYTDLSQSEPYRQNEQLNGLWAMGIRHYPQFGRFYDYYSESYDEAAGQYSYDEGLDYVVEIIRKYKPQVVVGQDIVNGEYGHGAHIWTAKLIADAIEISADPQQYAESAEAYGTWEVLKTYFHLYPENQIEFNARVPLQAFDGRTALEVAEAGYLQHQSQQWCWFYVSDGYDDYGNEDLSNPFGVNLSSSRYGLYDSKVGADLTGSDMLDNITVYALQEAEEQSAQEPDNDQSSETAAGDQTDGEMTQTELQSASSVLDSKNETAIPGGQHTVLIVILIIIAVIIAAVIVLILINNAAKKKEAERRRRAKMRAMDQMRKAQPYDRSVRSRQQSRQRPVQNMQSRQRNREDARDRYR